MTETLEIRPTPLRAGTPQAGTPQAADDAMTAGSDRYLTFMLGGEVFALPILDITEIMEFRSLTVVPMMPTFIRGVINLRGRVVPVVDMAARFGRGTTQIARRTSIIIVETPSHADDDRNQDMGIMVDAVNKVVHLSADDIEPPPAFGAGIRADFIAGMAKYDGQFIIVLDATRVLSLDEMAQLSRTNATTGHHPGQQPGQHPQHDSGHDPERGQGQTSGHNGTSTEAPAG
jgi:purine-binding chemotaxis protein CheW